MGWGERQTTAEELFSDYERVVLVDALRRYTIELASDIEKVKRDPSERARLSRREATASDLLHRMS